MRPVWEVEAPAKVNLRLRVLAREESGYHSLESLFCAIGLADRVRAEVVEGGVSLEVSGGIETGPSERNLAVLAAKRFREVAGANLRGAGVRIELLKRIPSAAGLGGGSSDAAATLRVLNRAAGEPLSEAELLQVGIELGSDVPFFLAGSPLALGWSRGERLLALPPLPEAWVVVAHPGEAMPTGAAFEGIARARGGGYTPVADRFHLRQLSDWNGVAAIATNDFEAGACAVIPRIAAALRTLRSAGAPIAMLAGSGASVYGIFPDAPPSEALDGDLHDLGFATWRCRTLAALPEVRKSAPELGESRPGAG